MLNFSPAKTYGLFDSAANRKTIAELEKIEADFVLYPNIAAKMVENAELENIVSDFDWLIFPDVYTVEFFLQKLEETGFEFYELDVLRVCAFGESVSDRLRFAQLHADIITNSIKTLDVLQSLKDYIFDESEFASLSFLILKEANAKVEISDELKKLDAAVTEIPIYQVEIENDAAFAKPKALLKGGAIDEFIFSSPFDAINLSHIFQTDNLAEVLAETELTATDNQTLQTLEEFRLV
ncbi:MAG TPA: uroporphyrinogen-III synthase [Pyrinomonadaceae bacterium]|nr:uroporphyrinogen-III synthase [Pyrinomonadaceae bacterium]